MEGDFVYLYKIKSLLVDRSLALMEMKYLFKNYDQSKYFFTEEDIDVNVSPFIQYRIKVDFMESAFDTLLHKIEQSGLSHEGFKVKYINIDKSVSFEEGHVLERKIGFIIRGEADVRNPSIIFGITHYNDQWIFGEYIPNENIWTLHKQKPQQYSNSLNTNVSRALVNIALMRNRTARLVDPCCGIGTVVTEALSMGVTIQGYDINPNAIEGAKRNLSFFHYDENRVNSGDIHQLQEHFDAAIIDLPYGRFSLTTVERQKEILQSARRIADRLVLVSIYNMNEYLEAAGFTVLDQCTIPKGNFARFVTLCI